MRLIDTSAWVEWLCATPLGLRLKPEFPPQSELVVPTMVQLELAKWLGREMGEDEADKIIAFTQLCVVVTLDTKIALLAAELSATYKLATADAIVYATAQNVGADLLTCDAHFKGLASVSYFAKN